MAEAQATLDLPMRIGDPFKFKFKVDDSGNNPVTVNAAKMEIYDPVGDSKYFTLTESDSGMTLTNNEIIFDVAATDLQDVFDQGPYKPLRYRVQVDVLSRGLDTFLVGDIDLFTPVEDPEVTPTSSTVSIDLSDLEVNLTFLEPIATRAIEFYDMLVGGDIDLNDFVGDYDVNDFKIDIDLE